MKSQSIVVVDKTEIGTARQQQIQAVYWTLFNKSNIFFLLSHIDLCY